MIVRQNSRQANACCFTCMRRSNPEFGYCLDATVPARSNPQRTIYCFYTSSPLPRGVPGFLARFKFMRTRGRTAPGRYPSAEATVNLGPDSGVSVSFTVVGDTKIVGRVFDPDGIPIERVSLALEAASGKTDTVGRMSGCTKSGGRQKLELMPAGRYDVVANETARQPFSTVCYPGTTDFRTATPIIVTMGRVAENVDVRVPAIEKLLRLAGRVLFSDGIPASRADVIYVSKNGYLERGSTAAGGSFGFPVLAGRAGKIHSEIMVWRSEAARCPQFGATFRPNGFGVTLKSPTTAIPGHPHECNISVALKVSSFKAWPAQ